MTGIRAEIEIGDPGACPVAQLSEEADTEVDSITWTSKNGENGTVVEEFSVDAGVSTVHPEMDQVFDHDLFRIYQFERTDHGCACEMIQDLITRPVSNVHARNGNLYVDFHVTELEPIKGVVSELREHFADVRVRQLTHSGGDGGTDFVWFDRNHLTPRQREVLQTAHDMGYFTYPKQANASEVAEALGIAPSTFSEHLAAAQSKITDALLD
ncbi:helix-turn-helix domain-containing protein [Halobacteriaceae archaeon GCM10025711]